MKSCWVMPWNFFGNSRVPNHAENENFRHNSISSKILEYIVNRCKIICSDTLGDVLSIMACLATFFGNFVLSWKKKILKKSWFFQKKLRIFFFENFRSQNHKFFFVANLHKNIPAFLKSILYHRSARSWGFCA